MIYFSEHVFCIQVVHIIPTAYNILSTKLSTLYTENMFYMWIKKEAEKIPTSNITDFSKFC